MSLPADRRIIGEEPFIFSDGRTPAEQVGPMKTSTKWFEKLIELQKKQSTVYAVWYYFMDPVLPSALPEGQNVLGKAIILGSYNNIVDAEKAVDEVSKIVEHPCVFIHRNTGWFDIYADPKKGFMDEYVEHTKKTGDNELLIRKRIADEEAALEKHRRDIIREKKLMGLT
jgi:hypothetical protein